jgi:anti-sigma B factor antagonist
MTGVGTQGGNREVSDGTLTIRAGDAASGQTVALFGELDMANAATLAAELERIEGEGPASITIDMRELEFIDSTGIAVLVSAYRRLNADTPRLRLVRSKASGVQRVMDVTGLERELPFVSTDDLPPAES